jgi:YfiH family protein
MPTPPNDWLVPDWLDSRIGALMTTRSGGFSAAPFDTLNLREGIGDDPAAVARNQALLAEAMGATPVWLDQVHGVRVVRLTAEMATQPKPVADGVITTERGLACVVQTADCLPVLFAAPAGAGVGAAHAGWRGLAAGVLEATVEALCDAARCTPADIDAWLGPCIGPRRFEVGADVLQAFGSAADDPARFMPHAPGKWMANLHLLARDRLQAAGVIRIQADATCTVEDAARFFSYRRDHVTGRMAAAVWLR